MPRCRPQAHPNPSDLQHHIFCWLVFVIFFLLFLSGVWVPCEPFFIKRNDNLWALHVSLFRWHKVCLVWIFPAGHRYRDRKQVSSGSFSSNYMSQILDWTDLLGAESTVSAKSTHDLLTCWFHKWNYECSCLFAELPLWTSQCVNYYRGW